MSQSTIEPTRLADLRSRAASRLPGTAGAKGSAAGAAGALAVLHELASSPSTAADALALLHELQVYQIELDLQAEELRESRVELESALRRQIALYDFQPVACFTIDARLVVHELNLAGAAMLGIDRGDAYGTVLDSCLSASSSRELRGLVAALAGDDRPLACHLRWRPKDGIERAVRADLTADRDSPRFLLVLTGTGDGRVTARRAPAADGGTPA